MTHKQRILELLKDGKAHSHHELYALGCVAHSRVADLRRDGHQIVQWREGDLYLYRLAGSLTDAPALSPSPQECGASVSDSASNLRLSSSGGATDDDAPGATCTQDGAIALFSLALYGDAA